MKTRKTIWLICGICLIAALGTGCKKENAEDEDTGKSTGYYVSGTYEGKLSMTVSGTDQGSLDTAVTLIGEDGNKVSIALPAMGSGKMSIPAVTLTGIPLTTSDYRQFTIPSTEVAFTGGESGTKYTGKLEGNVTGAKLYLKYSLKPGAMPMNIDFEFVPVTE